MPGVSLRSAFPGASAPRGRGSYGSGDTSKVAGLSLGTLHVHTSLARLLVCYRIEEPFNGVSGFLVGHNAEVFLE